MQTRLLISLIAAVLGSGFLSSAAAQRADAQRGDASRPGWRAEYEPDFQQMSAAQKASATATLDRIERIFWQIPVLARPHGFEVLTQRSGGQNTLPPPGMPFQYTFRLWFFTPSQAIAAGGGNTCIEVEVNRPGGTRPDPQNTFDEDGRVLFDELELGDPIPGTTVVHQRLSQTDESVAYVTLTTGGRSPWKSVTREQYLRALIFNAEGKNGEKETARRKSLQKTPYEQWLDEAAERKKNRDVAVASAAAFQSRAAVEELRKTLENTEREVTEQLKAQDADQRKQIEGLLARPSVGDGLRAQIAAMSPAQRASPATTGAGGGALLAPDDPQAHRILTPDLAFWRVRRTPTEVHGIRVALDTSHGCAHPDVQRAIWQTYHSLDWAALKRIVEESP